MNGFCAMLGNNCWLGLMCSFAYSHRNAFGRNQKLNISLERGQVDSMFRVNYTDPWIEGDDKRTSRSISIQVCERTKIDKPYEILYRLRLFRSCKIVPFFAQKTFGPLVLNVSQNSCRILCIKRVPELSSSLFRLTQSLALSRCPNIRRIGNMMGGGV